MPATSPQPKTRRALRPCLECGTPCAGPRCDLCTIAPAYGTVYWSLIRTARLVFDRYRCQLGYAGCTGRATSVHLDPAMLGDHSKATIGNTLSACAHCHGVEDGGRAAIGRAAQPPAAGGAAAETPTRAPEKISNEADPRKEPAASKFPCTGLEAA